MTQPPFLNEARLGARRNEVGLRPMKCALRHMKMRRASLHVPLAERFMATQPVAVAASYRTAMLHSNTNNLLLLRNSVMRNDKLSNQSLDFAIQIINLVKHLKDNRESIISNQIGRSGTSIGANKSTQQAIRQNQISNRPHIRHISPPPFFFRSFSCTSAPFRHILIMETGSTPSYFIFTGGSL